MAKEKHTAPYFLHDVDRGYKMRRIIKKFGNDGYAMWYSLLEQLCTHEQYYIFVDQDKLEDLSDYCNVDSKNLSEFMDYCSMKYPDHFDYELWSEYRIIRNNKLLSSLIDSLYDIDPKVEGKGNSKKRKGKVLTNSELKLKYKESKREVKVNITKVKEVSVTEQIPNGTPKIPNGNVEVKNNESSKFMGSYELDSNIQTINKYDPKLLKDEFIENFFKINNNNSSIQYWFLRFYSGDQLEEDLKSIPKDKRLGNPKFNDYLESIEKADKKVRSLQSEIITNTNFTFQDEKQEDDFKKIVEEMEIGLNKQLTQIELNQLYQSFLNKKPKIV